MVAIIPKETAYIVGGIGQNAAGVSDQKLNIVLAPGPAADVLSSTGYGVGSIGLAGAGASSVNAQAFLTNPTAVTVSNTYAIAANSLERAGVPVSKGYAVAYTFYPPYEDLVTELGFTEQQFPTCVSYGSSGGPGFKTSVFEVDSGLTVTDQKWERIRARYNANFDHVPEEDIASVENFFYACKGMAIGFRYKDWSDYIISQQNFALGDGTTQNFQIFKRYSSGGFTFDRIIRKPIGSTFTITLNGTQLIFNQDYEINDTTGNVYFADPPPQNAIATIVQGEFDVPVRFDTDQLDTSFDDFRQLNISSLPMIEILL